MSNRQRPSISRPLSRRDMLRVGSLAPLGLSLPGLLAAEAHGASGSGEGGTTFGRAKRCLLLFMWGGPAHQDLWDLKPTAPVGVRSEFKPIATNVPGINICEHLPHLARQMDKLALVRSVTHTDNNHSTAAHWMLTGHKHRLTAENFGASPTDSPHVGSVIAKLFPSHPSLPSFVSLPERIATTAGAVVPGQYAGVLGTRYDPFAILDHPDKPDFKIDMLALPPGVDAARVAARQQLLATLNGERLGLDVTRKVHAMQPYYQKAADLVTSTRARDAFDLTKESDRERDRYGRKTFGQSLLLARRLLEAGVRLVTVYWHRDMPGVDTTWDTHGQNFKQLKERLIPQVDQPIATLLSDLQDRGLLDETLIVWNSEFGRTPRVNGGAGRDHWGPCNSIWFAGGGVPGGQVFGASDKEAAYPKEDAVTPADVTATIFHQLGIAPDGVVHDREDRPFAISHGRTLDTVLSGLATPRDPLIATEAPKPIESKPNAEILADKPLGYWPLRGDTGRTSRDLAGQSAGQYLGDPLAGDARMQVTLPAWSDERYTVEFCFRNTLPFDASPVTAYLFSRAGAKGGGDHLGLGGSYRAIGDFRGRLFLFNGDNTKAGAIIGRTVLEVDRWYHVVFQRDGDLATCFVNGQFTEPEFRGPLRRTFDARTLFAAVRSDGLFPLRGELRDVAVFEGLVAPERLTAHWKASGV